MYKSWFHMELVINSYVMGKGGKRLDIFILSNTKCGSMSTKFRGGSRGGNFQPRVDKSLLYNHSQVLQPTNRILGTCQMKYQQVLMLIYYLCRFCTKRCSIHKGGQVFHGQNPVTGQYFYKLRN